jgi:outer membrane protein assembly factor BamA
VQPPQPRPASKHSVACREPSFLISQVDFSGADGHALRTATDAVPFAPGAVVTRADVVAARDAIVNTGLFVNVEPVAKSSRGGLSVEFKLRANAPLQSVKVSGAKILPPSLVDDIFEGAHGMPANQLPYLEVRFLSDFLSSRERWVPPVHEPACLQ